MKLLAWNCRGLAQPSTVRSLQAFLMNESPDIVFLTKTKSARHVASPIL
jgi:exonuclease III